MTRLSLHTRDENPKLSIRLSVGQYCTVGSSAAADYQIRAHGIDPVHCRIGCRPTGGYIECLDPTSKIVVNGVGKDRSRLTHGNTLRIGSVEMQVDLPELEIPVRESDVQFANEDTPTTKVDEPLAIRSYSSKRKSRSTRHKDSNAESAGLETGNRDVDQTNAERLDAERLDSGPSSESGSHGSARLPLDSADSPPRLDPMQPDHSSTPGNPRSEPDSAESDSAMDAIDPSDTQSRPIPSTRSVTFQFDSSEPDDLELSQADIDQMNQTSPHQNIIGNVDLESELDSESAASDDAAELDSQTAEEADEPTSETGDTTAEQSAETLKGGVYTDKHWKWTSSRAIAALKRVLAADNNLKIYQCDIKQIRPAVIEEFSLRWFKQQKCVVYLISHLDETELNTLTRSKRWDERIGHPQAVTMFLALSPKRIVSEFFDSIEACVLINEDLELVRRSRKLKV